MDYSAFGGATNSKEDSESLCSRKYRILHNVSDGSLPEEFECNLREYYSALEHEKNRRKAELDYEFQQMRDLAYHIAGAPLLAKIELLHGMCIRVATDIRKLHRNRNIYVNAVVMDAIYKAFLGMDAATKTGELKTNEYLYGDSSAGMTRFDDTTNESRVANADNNAVVPAPGALPTSVGLRARL
jgi:hypothetical protein